MWPTLLQKCGSCHRILARFPRCTLAKNVKARDTNTLVVPMRHFGQGERIRIFGHAKVKHVNKNYLGYILIVPFVAFIVLVVDWKRAKEYFGFSFKTLINVTTLTPLGDVTNVADAYTKTKNRPDRDIHFAFQENKAELHETMKREAMKRYQEEVDQLMKQDPELKALIEGQDPATIKVTDKEVFELKKQWVADYLEKVKQVN